MCVNELIGEVDICITTPMKALEQVCLLAKALADREYQMDHHDSSSDD